MATKKSEIKNLVADIASEAVGIDNTDPTERKERKTYTEAEKFDFAEEMKTAGRKGVKLPRLCIACTPSNYDYIRTMAKVSGQSISQFMHGIIEADYQQNIDKYETALSFRSEYWRRKLGK